MHLRTRWDYKAEIDSFQVTYMRDLSALQTQLCDEDQVRPRHPVVPQPSSRTSFLSGAVFANQVVHHAELMVSSLVQID